MFLSILATKYKRFFHHLGLSCLNLSVYINIFFDPLLQFYRARNSITSFKINLKIIISLIILKFSLYTVTFCVLRILPFISYFLYTNLVSTLQTQMYFKELIQHIYLCIIFLGLIGVSIEKFLK